MKRMIANRQVAEVIHDPKPKKQNARKKASKAERAKENTPGSRAMRKFIIEEKPGKTIVKDHLKAMMEDSSSDEE